jgi:hypothetical protein
LAAEADFGSEFMAQKRASATHEPFCSESRHGPNDGFRR